MRQSPGQQGPASRTGLGLGIIPRGKVICGPHNIHLRVQLIQLIPLIDSMDLMLFLKELFSNCFNRHFVISGPSEPPTPTPTRISIPPPIPMCVGSCPCLPSFFGYPCRSGAAQTAQDHHCDRPGLGRRALESPRRTSAPGTSFVLHLQMYVLYEAPQLMLPAMAHAPPTSSQAAMHVLP